jgi:uncharacterized membrane protein (UPF0127 family)
MSFTKIIIIFGIILVLFAGFVFYQFNASTIRQALGGLPTTDVTIDKQTFHVEVAKDEKTRQIGLSEKKSLADNGGMLFVFDAPALHPFWMRGMDFPIDMIFIHNNKIVAIYSTVQPIKDTENGPLYGADVLSDRVLEIKAGMAKKYLFNKGDTVSITL